VLVFYAVPNGAAADQVGVNEQEAGTVSSGWGQQAALTPSGLIDR